MLWLDGMMMMMMKVSSRLDTPDHKPTWLLGLGYAQ
jgi:hypothetical protein